MIEPMTINNFKFTINEYISLKWKYGRFKVKTESLLKSEFCK